MADPLHPLGSPQELLEEILQHFPTLMGASVAAPRRVLGYEVTERGLPSPNKPGQELRQDGPSHRVRARYLSVSR